MPPRVKPHSPPLSRRRIEIRDRAHARDIAQRITFGSLFNNGGTPNGFADWLFANRQTFNGANPLGQAKPYLAEHRDATLLGIDFDAQCRKAADRTEQIREQARVDFEANFEAIKAAWTETPFGPDATRAIAELCFGRGHCFAANPAGNPSPHPPSACVLDWLLNTLERFGGPAHQLHQNPWMASEDNFKMEMAMLDEDLERIHGQILHTNSVSNTDLVYVTSAAMKLSRMRRIRATLDVLLLQSKMHEHIDAAVPSDSPVATPRSLRRNRLL